MSAKKQVVACGGFDDIRSRDLRFLEEAAKLGELAVLLWPDALLEKRTGKAPKFPLAERTYFLNAVRYVNRVIEANACDTLPATLRADVWADIEASANLKREVFASDNNITYRVFTADELRGFPEPPPMLPVSGRRRIAVTGCYDWFHSGHVRFFEEACAYGDLYVFLGNDECIRQLKGDGHPLLGQDERRYLAGSIRFVTQATISSGSGWLDFDREIRALKADILVVNEDGDKGGKREYCRELGIEYMVLKRTPAPGLASRSSTDLRGF